MTLSLKLQGRPVLPSQWISTGMACCPSCGGTSNDNGRAGNTRPCGVGPQDGWMPPPSPNVSCWTCAPLSEPTMICCCWQAKPGPKLAQPEYATESVDAVSG